MQTTTETTGKAKTAPKTPASKKATAKIHEPATIAEVKLIPVELIDTLPQLRRDFDQKSIEYLAKTK